MSTPDPDVYGFSLSARAMRDLDSLPGGAALACLNHLAERVVVNPHRLGGPLTGKWAGCRSCHVDAYRVVYKIDEDRRRVRVVHIGYRGTVYNG